MGLLFSRCQPLRHFGGRTKGKVYRYYEPACRFGQKEGARIERFRALELERAVLATLDPEARLRSVPMDLSEARDFVRSLIERIDIGPEMVLALKTGQLLRAPAVGRTDTLDLDRRRRNGKVWTPFEIEVDPTPPG